MENINQFEVKSVGKNLIDELKKAPVDTASIISLHPLYLRDKKNIYEYCLLYFHAVNFLRNLRNPAVSGILRECSYLYLREPSFMNLVIEFQNNPLKSIALLRLSKIFERNSKFILFITSLVFDNFFGASTSDEDEIEKKIKELKGE